MSDSLMDAYLASPRVAALFDARATLAAMLQFEAALSRAEATLGMIPASAADLIAAS